MTVPSIGIVIQARMSSERLPGKVLRPLAGRPMLGYLLERLARVRADWLVVATSSDASDDPLTEWSIEAGVDVHRGPLDDVAVRFLGAATERDARAVVRISGDSPLLDDALVDRALTLWRASEPTLVTNVFPRSFPKGQSVEVIDVPALRAAVGAMTNAAHREHVTPWFYERPALHRIVSFTRELDASSINLSVDEPADADHVARILESMTRPHWTYTVDELIELHHAVSPR